jgi:hypothetical protein
MAFFPFFMNFFSFFKMVFVDFASLFFLYNTVDCYNVSPYDFYFVTVFSHTFFFQNYLC